MKFIELFAGIGGFRYGLEMASRNIMCDKGRGQGEPNAETRLGFSCCWANEIDRYACQIYRKNYGEGELYEGDITKVKAENIPDHDLLVGGFPCQAFSIAGKRRGFNDTRGTLFFEIARIAREKQPRFLLLENVKGLLSHAKGRTFGTILSTLDEIGYDLQWQVLNSKNFGVPQNRERVFIVGHLRGTSRSQVFPIKKTTEKSNSMLSAKRVQERKKTRYDTIKYEDSEKCVDNYINANNWQDYICDSKFRTLTLTEKERLQGLPDGWTEGIKDNERHKCLGNAVTTNVIQAIGERLCKHEQ